jgi:8-oxo-dGTP diphosphatase
MARKKGRQHSYDYPRPALTVDIAVLKRSSRKLQVLLIRRKHKPFAGRWALPGGFVDENETLEAAARRELEEETCIRGVELTELGAYGDPGRDPRGWTVSVLFYCVVKANAVRPKAADDAAQAQWFPLAALPPLAFDHDKMLAAVRRRFSPLPSAGEEQG